MAGEIATAFVRIRPNLTGFKQTATAGVKTALSETQVAVNTAARENVAATTTEIRANEALAASYQDVLAAARLQVASVEEGVAANAMLARAYAEVGVAAKAGSVEQIAAIKLQQEATLGAARTVQEAAAANVAATVREITANEELAASYGTIAAAAAAGSREQIAAAGLAASAAARAAASAPPVVPPKVKTGLVAGLGVGGQLLGVGIGVAFAANFVKGLAQQAAEVQKSQEVVRAEFGKSAEVIETFASKGAAALGITDDAALGTAAKLGIVFQNLGIGHKIAADMTVNLEKLAGSLSAIRGIDPGVALKALNLAMLGNVRSLKQLGIAVDPVTIKYVAFKQGLISSVKDALTPAARAQAIYAISTEHLASFQALAKKHADDLSNSQRTLAAQWDDAKDKLGADLLPAFSGFVEILGKTLKAFLALPTAAKGAIAAIAGIGVAIAAIALGLSPIVGIPLAIIAVGLAFNEAYRHSEKFRAVVHGIGDVVTGTLIPALKNVAHGLVGAFADVATIVKAALAPVVIQVKVTVAVIMAVWDAFGGTIKTVIANNFGAVAHIISNVFKEIGTLLDLFAAILTGKWGKAWADLKKLVSLELDNVKTVVVTFKDNILAIFTGMWTGIEKLFLTGLKEIADLLGKIPTKITIFGKTIGSENPFKGWAEGLQSTIDGLNAQGHQAGQTAISGVAAGIKASTAKVRDAASNVGKNAIAGVADGVQSTGKTLAQQAADYNAGIAADAAAAKAKIAAQKAADVVTKAESGVTTLRNRITAAISKQADEVRKAAEDAKANLSGIGQSLGQSLATIIDQPFVIAGEKIQAAQNRITLEFDRKSQKLQAQAAAITRQQAQIAFGTDRLALSNLRQSVVLPGGGPLSTNNAKALKQLQELSKTTKGGNKAAIDAFILQFRSASLQVESDKVGLKQSALDAKKTVLTNALQLKSEVLAVEQDTANRLKTQIARQISDLTDAFNRHVITYARFKSGIADIVAKGAPAMKAAGTTLGSAFAHQYVQQTQDILKQAGLIAAGPQVKGATGQDSKLVNPQKVFNENAAAVAQLRHQLEQKQHDLTKKIAKHAAATEKYLAVIAAAQKKHPTSKGRNPGKQTDISAALVGAGAGPGGHH